MPRKATAQAKNKQQSAAQEDDVDKIRDIIFGGQMREYAQRFEELERTVTGAVDRLVKDVDKRFADLERVMGGHIQKVADKLTTEREQRKTEHSTTKHQLKEMEKLIDSKLTDSDGRLAAELDEVHGVVEEEVKALNALIEKLRAEMNKLVSAEATRLDKDKLASKDLAQLFTEVARRLKGNG